MKVSMLLYPVDDIDTALPLFVDGLGLNVKFRDGDRYLDSDAVFGVRSTLVADWVRHAPGIAPDGSRMDTPFYTLDYDFVLNPAERAA